MCELQGGGWGAREDVGRLCVLRVRGAGGGVTCLLVVHARFWRMWVEVLQGACYVQPMRAAPPLTVPVPVPVPRPPPSHLPAPAPAPLVLAAGARGTAYGVRARASLRVRRAVPCRVQSEEGSATYELVAHIPDKANNYLKAAVAALVKNT